jgi:hypothetical protein
MSLDVYLYGETRTTTCTCQCGHEHPNETRVEFYCANITHNLNVMAEEAGIYRHLWRPDEIGITKASQLIEPISLGLALMKAEPERFKAHDASNGWGTYEDFIPWIERYLHACRTYPDATVEVSR